MTKPKTAKEAFDWMVEYALPLNGICPHLFNLKDKYSDDDCHTSKCEDCFKSAIKDLK